MQVSIETLKYKTLHYSEIAKQFALKIEPKSFATSLVGVVLFYTLISFYVSHNAAKTIESLNAKLPAETVHVEHIKKNKSQLDNDYPHDKKAELIDGLSEEAQYGLIPKIRVADNLTSFRAYQTPFDFKNVANKPVIAFSLLDYGLSTKNSLLALEHLPAEVSFILSPDTKNPDKWVARAQQKGHEVWLYLPIQSKDANDQGTNTIFHHAPIVKKESALQKNLSKTLGYVGVATFADHTMDNEQGDYEGIIEQVFNRGLGILNLSEKSPKWISNKAFSKGAPYITTNIHALKMKGEKESYDSIEAYLQTKDVAVVKIPSYPKTITSLADWIEKIARADYAIAPVSAIYDLPLYRSKNNINNDQQP